MIGETLDGKYRIVRLLGRGGMGSVYEGEPLAGGQRVAIKCIAANLLHHGESAVGRFEREAKATGALDTEHIVRVLDAGTDAATKTPFMVMELLEGEDLQLRLDRAGALRSDAALRIAAQLCLGLQKAHEARIVHRDIKPANVFLARRGEGDVTVKILDFGIAKIRPDPSQGGATTGLTFTGGMLGTPRFMSPEQARGIKGIDHRTDIWSLGMVLYCTLSGKLPYEGIDAFGDLIMAICSRVPRPLAKVAPWVQPEVAAVVEGALQLDPGDRFPGAGAMLDAIRPLLPDGWALREELLVSVDVGERSSAANTPTMTLPPEFFSTLQSDSAAARSERLAGMTPADEPRGEGRFDRSGTTAEAGVTTSDREPRARAGDTGGRGRPLWSPAVAAAVTAAVGLASFGLYKAWSPGGQSADPASGVADAAPLGPSSSAPLVTPAPEARRVHVAVSPAGVSVEIEGKPVQVEDGKVEIVGTLGSVHHIRLFNANGERRGEVIVTELGASPTAMELDAAKPGSPSATATGAKATATGAKAAMAGPKSAAAGTSAAVAPAPAATAQAAPPKPVPTRDPLAPDEFR